MHSCMQHMDAWDFLWSITAKAMLAAEVLRPGEQQGARRMSCDAVQNIIAHAARFIGPSAREA